MRFSPSYKIEVKLPSVGGTRNKLAAIPANSDRFCTWANLTRITPSWSSSSVRIPVKVGGWRRGSKSITPYRRDPLFKTGDDEGDNGDGVGGKIFEDNFAPSNPSSLFHFYGDPDETRQWSSHLVSLRPWDRCDIKSNLCRGHNILWKITRISSIVGVRGVSLFVGGGDRVKFVGTMIHILVDKK